mmetsp:Transcript_13347/g.14955  ORF Transcript_13347/g.14955 Transcript_13347/m.14955 type:complete len:80 (-) Transcript_13347:36-275(-)
MFNKGENGEYKIDVISRVDLEKNQKKDNDSSEDEDEDEDEVEKEEVKEVKELVQDKNNIEGVKTITEEVDSSHEDSQKD